MKIIKNLVLNNFGQSSFIRKQIGNYSYIKALRYPPYLFIEPTKICNFRCKMCPHSIENSQKKYGYLNIELFREIINQSICYGKRINIYFHKTGEPLLNKDLPEMIKYVVDKKASLSTHFATNGSLLSPDLSGELIHSGLGSLVINIDAANKKTYSKLKGVSENVYDKVCSNVLFLMNLKRKNRLKNPFVIVKLVVDDDNKSEIEEFKAFWNGKVDKVEIKNQFVWPGSSRGDCFSNNRMFRPDLCSTPYQQAVINWDGTVSACCLDYHHKAIIGDIKKDSLFDIWRGEKARILRRNLIEKRFQAVPLCLGCSPVVMDEETIRRKEKQNIFVRLVKRNLS